GQHNPRLPEFGAPALDPSLLHGHAGRSSDHPALRHLPTPALGRVSMRGARIPAQVNVPPHLLQAASGPPALSTGLLASEHVLTLRALPWLGLGPLHIFLEPLLPARHPIRQDAVDHSLGNAAPIDVLGILQAELLDFLPHILPGLILLLQGLDA